MLKLVSVLFLIVWSCQSSWGQCTTVTATAPEFVCLNEKLNFTNSTVANSFEWDFCPGNLKQTPTANLVATLSGLSTAVDIKVVNDGDLWYALVLDNSGKIFLADFGSNINAEPAISTIGNLDGQLVSPSGLDVVKDGANWFVVVAHTSSSKLSLLNFGGSLTNLPTVSQLPTTLSGSDSYSVVRIVALPNQEYALFVTEFSSNLLKIFRFPNGLEGTPENAINVVLPTSILDVQVFESCGLWSAFVAGFGSKSLYRVDFGNSFSNSPSIQTLGTFTFFPYRVWAGREGAEFYVFVTNAGGGIVKLELGTDLANNAPSISDLGDLGVLSASYNVDIVNDGGKWSCFMVNGSISPPMYRLAFPDNCGASSSLSFDTVPQNISFEISGDMPIALTSFSTGNTSSVSLGTTVKDVQSPTIDFSSSGSCSAQPLLFTSSVQEPISQYEWNFGDGSSNSNLENPQNQFAAGLFEVTLHVVAATGCASSATRQVQVFDPPVASFSVPNGIFCTNNSFSFTNNTTDNFNGLLTYEWFINDQLIDNQRDLQYTFLSTGQKQIKLIASIPGCADEEMQTISNVGEGPVVGFSTEGQCVGEQIRFSNQSSGDIAGFEWDLAGQSSTETNPVTTFSTPGIFQIKLNAISLSGCVSENTMPLSIYSQPSPLFTLDLPPFSCAGSASQFRDATVLPEDSNLESWEWSFGDGEPGDGKNPTHLYPEPGNYQVSLKITSDKGCVGTTTSEVVIHPSPTVSLDLAPACVNQPLSLQANTSSDISTWEWNIGNSTYTTANPTHVFISSGSYQGTLNVVASNGCPLVVPIEVEVPNVPSLSFEVQMACIDSDTKFSNTSAVSVDPFTAIRWLIDGQVSLEGSEVTYTFQETGTFEAAMTVTAASGCSYMLSKNFLVSPSPSVNFTAAVEEGVPPFEVQFENLSTGATGYQWKVNNVDFSEEVEPSLLISQLGEFVIDVIATSSAGCQATATHIVRSIIPQTEMALIGFNLIEDEVSQTKLSQLVVQNNSNYKIREFDVVVDLGNSASLKERITQEIPAGQTATFLLSNALVGASSGYVCVTLSVVDDQNATNNSICNSLQTEPVLFAPSPNPASDKILVQVVSSIETSATIRITGMQGSKALELSVPVTSGLSQIAVDISRLNPGLYILSTEVGLQRTTHRIMIE